MLYYFLHIHPQNSFLLCIRNLSTAVFIDAKSCSSIADCQKTHVRAIKSDLFSHGFFGDRLVSAYVLCGRSDYAHQLFDEIPNKDLVSWNSISSAFLKRGNATESLKLFSLMRLATNLKPNDVTLVTVLPACAKIQAIDEGKCIHSYVVKTGFSSELKVVNSLINMYGKCGSVNTACQLFEIMPVRNLVSWNSIISMHTQNGFAEDAINIFNSMRRNDFEPDRATILSVLQACANLAVVRQGKVIHGYIVSCGFGLDVPIATALINMYAKSGNLDTSYEVFCEMINPDAIAWTAMLAGYAINGQGREAIFVFACMVDKGLKPDHVTFTHVLSACSHSGLVIEGKNYFKIMAEIYGIEPRVDHYSCMVDLLGRSGLLKEARQMIENMSIEPNSAVWGALLGACRIHNNIKIGKEAAERLFALDPSDPRNYIILSNMYSATGMWRDASKVRALMKERGVRKKPGCSFIEHDGKVHRFVVGDQSHPETEMIYMKLHELTRKMRESGYVPKTEFVLHDVDEVEKGDLISIHSEKLAIAFGLLVIRGGVPIMITKNLRICGDCHSMAKFISLIEKRRIVIRDSKRFHHFANGCCSCGDYW
ncbi:tetratricopeptide repeat (TPR)-like superfamily protein [Tasmannia lanceolata]|uniref:tetratricopeptide repeat (TPR)-like superfamily protein n=1 Tax=Tasmannia lanceolata TaxID=3420 RepID=UPI00406389E2